MADIPMGIMAHWWYSFPIDHFALPRVEAWYQRIRDRPAFQKSVGGPYAHGD
jgi:glutathione S-transferase